MFIGEGGESASWVVLIYESIKAGAIEQATRRFATAGTVMQRVLLRCCPPAFRERRLKHLRNSREKALRRMNAKTEHRDFLWYILKQREKKNEVSDDEVIMNAALFMYVSLCATFGSPDCRVTTANKLPVLQEVKRPLLRCLALPIFCSETALY